MRVIEINGTVERLDWPRPRERTQASYGREQPGRADAEAMSHAARQDRRRRRRAKPDPFRGRLLDLTT